MGRRIPDSQEGLHCVTKIAVADGRQAAMMCGCNTGHFGREFVLRMDEVRGSEADSESIDPGGRSRP